MSLHALADHMAARGRGPDTTLVHMAPQEVAGLQALAMAHGGSLTINPDTGLPEAGFLKKLLPAIAGFALNAFAPGFGSAIGAALGGLGSAAGTAIGLGGITGLATGSLQKGLMAGLGAYGGASLAGGVMGAGAMELSQTGAPLAENIAGSAVPPIEQINPANFGTNVDKLGAGFNAITKDPAALGNFAKNNWQAGLAVTSPLLADQGVQTVTKLDNPGLIRNFDYDPLTQRARALNPVSVKDLGYAEGGEIGAPKTITQMPGTSPYRDSQAAYEYLMGIAPKVPEQTTQTQTQNSSANPVADGRYAWDSDKKAYTWMPANGLPAPAPDTTPSVSYAFDYGGGGGDSSASSSSDSSSDSGSSSGPGGSSGESGAAAGGAGPGGPGGADGASSGDGGASGGGGGGAAGDGGSGSGDGGGSGSGGGDGGSGGGDGGGGGGDGGGEANGGLMRLHKKFAEGGRARDGSSQAAFDYLMGLAGALPSAPAATQQQVYIPQAVAPATPATGGITTLPTTTPSAPTGGITTLPTTPVEPVTPTTPTTPTTPVTPVTPTTPTTTTTTTTQVDDFVPSVRTKPIISTITDDVDRETIPRIIPTTPLELPDIPKEKTGIVEIESVDPNTTIPDVVGPKKGGGGDLPEEFDQYLKPDGTTTTTDGGVTVTVPETTSTATPDGGATVNMPEVIEKIATTPVVQDTPDGGATVTIPDNVADTFDPDTVDYGDFGDSGFEQSDDFGKYGLGVSHFGGSGGGGGKFFDDNALSVLDAANGGLMSPGYAMGGGLGSLGGYSDGGRLLKGPGDGVSDSIPAVIGNKQPARLADGEFVVPARIVSELGNGSTEAGARKLYKMMDRIQAARGKTVGKGRVAKNSRADKHLPA